MIKQLTLVLSFALSVMVAGAQTTYNYEGAGCGSNYFCHISPAMDIMAGWVATAPVNGGTPQAKYTVMTGLNVSLGAYPSFAAIPEHLTGQGTGTFDWFTGTGNGPNDSGSFTLPVNSTWDYTPIPNPIQPNNPIREFTEVVITIPDPNGSAEAVTFTRHWWATQGPRGGWYLHQLIEGGLGAGSIVDTSTLTN